VRPDLAKLNPNSPRHRTTQVTRLRDALARCRVEIESLYNARELIGGNFTPHQEVHYRRLILRERALLEALAPIEALGAAVNVRAGTVTRECGNPANEWRVAFKLKGTHPTFHHVNGDVEAWTFAANINRADKYCLLEELWIDKEVQGTWHQHHAFTLHR
jgi:hypothetical protein